MDTLRGNFDALEDSHGHELGEDDVGREAPPLSIGQDERRMQVRAYNHWASLLEDRNFPAIEDLEPDNLPDFGPYSVLLDFTAGLENPGIAYLGDQLAGECDISVTELKTLSDVPSRSLLSRITDHYMQILANQAPIGFEAEFVNQRGQTILYRGILLPFSADDERIDHIYGVINWKELADQKTTDELLLEIDQVLEGPVEPIRELSPLTAWADGPTDDSVLELVTMLDPEEDGHDWPDPMFGGIHFRDLADEEDEASLPVLSESDADDMELADWLASARELADLARGSEDRSHQALYAAIGRAYDFSLAAAAEPEQFKELLEDAGLVVQERAPLTPVVKLVFGADYDKTRLAEYASVLGYAQRVGLDRGALAGHLVEAAGGLKGIVADERRLRREESGTAIAPREAPRKTLQSKLRKLEHVALADLPSEGSEFTLLVARRLESGEIVLLGEVGDDVPLFERAAKKLVA